MLTALLVMLACYLIGSIPFPVLVSRYAMGIDLRQHGSGNMGAMNAARVLGKKWFPVVFGLDFAKGAAATYLAAYLLPHYLGIDPTLGAALGGTLVVFGHCFPVFAGFKGGVGLAATAGALAMISLWLLLVSCAGILLFWALTRNMYVGVAVTALLYPGLAWAVGLNASAVVGVMAIWGLVVFGVHFKDVRGWVTGQSVRR